MSSQYARTQASVRRAQDDVIDLMNVAGVDDSDPVVRRVASAFENLHEVLATDIPKSGRTASAIHEEGPLVRVIPHRDMRYWKKVFGGRILKGSRFASRMASGLGLLFMPSSLQGKRVITASQYHEALDDAVIERAEDLDSIAVRNGSARYFEQELNPALDSK